MLVLELRFRSNENWEMNSPLEDHGTTSEEMSLEPFLREGSGGGMGERHRGRTGLVRVPVSCAVLTGASGFWKELWPTRSTGDLITGSPAVC